MATLPLSTISLLKVQHGIGTLLTSYGLVFISPSTGCNLKTNRGAKPRLVFSGAVLVNADLDASRLYVAKVVSEQNAKEKRNREANPQH